MTIPDFVSRCDRYCEAANRSRTWLSKELFHDTTRIADLAAGTSDVGVKRLDRAVRKLADLDRALRASRQDIAA